MKIQIVCDAKLNLNNENIEIQNDFEDIESLSLYDLNIIDLNYADWENSENNYKKNDGFIILESLGEQLKTYKQTKIILILPTEATFYYDYSEYLDRYNKKVVFKDNKNIFLSILNKTIFKNIFNDIDLIYENTIAKICEDNHYSTHYIKSDNISYEEKLKDVKNNRILALKSENIVITTIDILDAVNENELKIIYNHFFLDEQNDKPKWFEELEYFDDSLNKIAIENEKNKILECQKIIEKKLNKLARNNYYKSILYSTGDELVTQIFSILEEMLGYSLDSFIDKKNEDFLIKLDDLTLVGEIKGVSKSVKSANIAQTEKHLRIYLDDYAEENENGKGILIINPQRMVNPKMREKVHENEKKLAIKYEILVILTEDLLKLYEIFVNKKISSKEIMRIFKEEIGVFTLDTITME